MDINLDQALVEINWNRFLRIEHAAGTTLSCVSGSLWVTRDNCIKDFELLPGDSYVAEGRQSLTVCGFEPSVVRVFQPQPGQARRSPAWNATLDRTVSYLTNAFASLSRAKQSR